MSSDERPRSASAMTVGIELRQAREALGLSLRDVSERTKIRQPALRAIESDDLRQLPGGAIGRGFVKLYAREVGLDAHEMGERFDQQRDSEAAGGFGGDPGAAAGALSGLSSWFTPARAAMVFAAIAVVAVASFLLRRGPEPSPAPAEAPIASEVPAPVEPPPAPAPVAVPSPAAVPASTPPAKAAQVPPGTVRVELLASGDCWVAATADGEQVVYRMLPAGERATMNAKSEAVVRIGMPANVAVTINGRPMRPFERPGSPITLRITPDNYRDLVQ